MRFDIYKDGLKINTIVSDEEFCKNYCQTHQYVYAVVEDTRWEPIDEDIPELDSREETSREDEIDFMLVDHEYRLVLVELGVSE